MNIKKQEMSKPHILMIPYPVQGHVMPLMQLAQSLAKYDLKITFVNIESTHKKIINSLAGKHILLDQIHLISISLDESEKGDDKNVPGKLSEAILKVMPGKVEKLIQENNEDENITCVIADRGLGWALEIAEKMGIKRAAFLTAAASNYILGFSIPKLIDDGIIDNNGTPAKQDHTFQFEPTMPIMNTSDLVWTRMGNLTMQKIVFDMMVRNNKAVKSADYLICNSTYDLEPGAFNLAPEIVPIGPLLASICLEPSNAGSHISSGESTNCESPVNVAGSFWPEDSTCLKWLDQQALCSVIYVAFGSTTIFNETQFQELALGLELANKPFLWVVRHDALDATNDVFLKKVVDKIGRTKGKIVSWAPQLKVLSHPSIGCFVSHCGWNSTIEAISNGVPILCWPYFADQFMNQSYICDIWKVGLPLKREANGIISCGEIKDKVDQLLGNDSFKKIALQLKEMTLSSIKEGGRSRKNFINFIQWIKSSF